MVVVVVVVVAAVVVVVVFNCVKHVLRYFTFNSFSILIFITYIHSSFVERDVAPW